VRSSGELRYTRRPRPSDTATVRLELLQSEISVVNMRHRS